MPEWLTEAAAPEESFSAGLLAIRLIVALAFGGLVAVAYRVSHGRNEDDANVMAATLVLLSVLIAMVSLVIGNSVARAFSLVGALSIVRFRTVVDDTRDTAFVIFAVTVGMAAGAGQFLVPVIGIPLVSLAAVLLNRPRRLSAVSDVLECKLHVRLVLGRSPEELVNAVLARHGTFRVIASSTARQGAALDVSYLVQMKSEASLTQLVSELNQVEGILSVELRQSRNE